MPDKLWIHKDTKYNTGDGVYAYQYEFAQDIEDEGIENFVEYVPTDTFIENAIGWIDYNNRNGGCFFNGWEKDFKKYMKGK